MKRFYVIPKTLLLENIPETQPAKKYHSLFHKEVGHGGIDLGDTGLLLISTDFSNDRDEMLFHEHPEVARLGHPSEESTVPVGNLLSGNYSHKQFQQKHMDALKTKGIVETDTVWDIHKKASKVCPTVSLGSKY